MAEELIISKGLTKEEKYQSLLPQVKALIGNEPDMVANMANLSAALKQAFDFFWVGFYRVIDNELVLGPFQGPIACTRIRMGRGVCGTAWKEQKTLVVPDVDQFPGHIACNAASQSEIVIPFKDSLANILGVLDIDSDTLNTFDEIDARYLNKMLQLLTNIQ